MKTFTKEDLLYNRTLKKALFEVLLQETNTFYLHCKNHPQLYVGERGLKGKEKEEGIILVFGPYSYRNLDWNEKGISCEMNFGKWENVFVPYECIFRIFDKAGHFVFQFLTLELPDIENESHPKIENKDAIPVSELSEEHSQKEKIIKIDFQKKKKDHE